MKLYLFYLQQKSILYSLFYCSIVTWLDCMVIKKIIVEMTRETAPEVSLRVRKYLYTVVKGTRLYFKTAILRTLQIQ